jgi:HK97 family phage major capsid protein
MNLMKHIRSAVASADVATRSAEFVGIARAIMLGAGKIEAEEMCLSPRAVDVLKSAVASGSTTGTGWASELAAYNLITQSFIQTLAGFGAFDSILTAGGFVRVPMHTQIAVTTLAATAGTVAEGAPKPISRLTLAGATLVERKSVAILAVTKELVKHASPGAANLLADELRRSLARAVDDAILNAIIQDTAIASSPGTGNFAEDISTAVASLTGLGSTSKLFLIGPPAAVRVMALKRGSGGPVNDGAPVFPDLDVLGGDISGITVIPSDALSTDIVVLDGAQCAADAGPITLDKGEHVSLQLEDVPAGGSQSLTSLWQQNKVALRATRYWAFELLRPGAAAVISEITA